ncbi:AMP-binding protein [Paenibacillus sp. FSL K6-1096]|uniref:AMP-binding protein n=1 Tax=Paenibacillus sp. FSL K6-1096 TaxID=2921460 RepID=UPI0030EB9782
MLAQALINSAMRHADRTAVKYNDQSLTYGQLITRAKVVALKLRRLAAEMNTPEEPVCGLVFSHGIPGIIGVVASVLAGLVYVPLDASYPPGRLADIARHSGISILVTDFDTLPVAEALAAVHSNPVSITMVDDISCNATGQYDLAEKHHSRVYLLYTSGSTGIPKGVIQHEEPIIHFAEAYIHELQITPNDRLTLFSTFGHDAAVIDIFAGLLSGACLYPLDLRIPENLLRLPGWLSRNSISVWHSVPSLFRTFFTSVRRLPALPALRLAVLGGEALRSNDYTLCSKKLPGTGLYSLYGQTESSYSSGLIVTQAEDASAVGLPLPGTKLLIALGTGSFTVISPSGDWVQESCPLLSTYGIEDAELLIASPYIAEGYYKDSYLSDQAFFTSPKFGRLYRTGDLVEPDGAGRLIFRGRKDSLIKIRGYRVEPGEIESYILTITGVKECAVCSITRSGPAALTAFIHSDRPLLLTEVNRCLEERLPAYMLLSEVVNLEQFPYTLTGKIDRKKLVSELEHLTLSERH